MSPEAEAPEPGQMACATYDRCQYPGATRQDLLRWWKTRDGSSRAAWAAVEATIRADQRERDAQIADAEDGLVRPGDFPDDDYVGHPHYGPHVAERIASAIRSRTEAENA